MKILLPLILILFAAPCFGESWLCIVEKSFAMDNKNNYSLTDVNLARWVVKRINNENYQVSIHGKSEVYFLTESCRRLSLERIDKLILCNDIFQRFVFNLDTLRFEYTTGGDYIYEDTEHYPRLQFGKCSKI